MNQEVVYFMLSNSMVNEYQKGDNHLFSGAKPLIITGFIGLCASLVILIYIFFNGSLIPPDGNLYKPFSFNAALGLFLIDIAAFISLTGLSKRGKVIWIRWMIFAATGAYTIETIQPLRGVDPRFARNHHLSDILIGSIGMTFFSILIMLLTIIFAWKLNTSNTKRKMLVYSLNWSMIIILLGFVIGIIILVARLSGDYRGQYDMYISVYAHGFTFHSLQALPVIAWLLERTSFKHSKKMLNATGVIWIVVTALIYVQNYLSYKIYEGPIFIINLFLIFIYLCVFVYSCARHYTHNFKQQMKKMKAEQ
jgi:hypothetical protein